MSFLSRKLADIVFLSMLSAFALIHFSFVRYFAYTAQMLDSSLFGNSLQEALFTVRTTPLGKLSYLLLLVSAIIPWVVNTVLKKFKWIERYSSFVFLLFTVLLLLSIFINPPTYTGIDITIAQRTNKSIYFYKSVSRAYLSAQPSNARLNENNWQIYTSNFPEKQFESIQYPLLYKNNNNDVLSAYIKKSGTLPNIVIIIVEGFGDKFLNEYYGINLMPFTKKLSEKGLYWGNFLCTSQRSFAALPSITGSLPHAERGFTIQDRIPNHFSLYNILKTNGYQTAFYYGQGRWFHRKINYCLKNGVETIVDMTNYNEKYDSVIVKETGYFWGYRDLDLFKQYLDVIDTLPQKPRFDVFFTGSMHPPYAISNEGYYKKKLGLLITGKNVSAENNLFLSKYGTYIRSILYFDDVLKFFIEEMGRRADFENTIFIITGDHPITDLPFDNPLQRFHVPLIIYSPLLNRPAQFKSLNSQFDIAPSVLSYLEANHRIKVPPYTTFIGSGLDTLGSFSSNCFVPIMGDNREIENLVRDTLYLSENAVYSISDGILIHEIPDSSKASILREQLSSFKAINNFVNWENRLMPDTLFFNFFNNSILKSFEHKGVLASKKKYYDLIFDSNFCGKERIYCEFSCELLEMPAKDKTPSIVYEFKDKNNHTLKWQNAYLTRNGDNAMVKRKYADSRLSLSFPADSVPEALKVYIWNEKEAFYKIQQCKLVIYTD
ncbi:MAG: LTA synthase family protein [Bacteroidales bacterium]|nr:LTA synthase family protein [Bacteroidales bacterium]